MKLKICVLILSLLIFGSFSTLDAQDDSLSALGIKWSPDGRWLVANTNSGVRVFDVENPDAEPQIYYEGAEVDLMAFNPNNNELAVVIRDWNEYVYKNGIINLDTGEASEAEVMIIGGVRSQLGPISAMSQVYELSYTADGAYGILTMDNVIYFYEPTFHRVDFFQRGTTDPDNYLVSVAQIGDTGNFLALTWSEGDNLTMVNREGGLLSSHEPEHSGDVVYYLHDTRAILPARDGIYIYDFGSEEEELLLAAPEGNYIDASAYFAPPRKFLLGGYGFWQSIDMVTGEASEIVEVESEEEHMRFVAFSFKGDATQFVGLQSDGVLSIWDIETGELLNSWQAFDSAFSIKWG